MNREKPPVPADEPLGIIISRGSTEEPTPLFTSYVWGPVPEPSDSASNTSSVSSASRAA